MVFYNHVTQADMCRRHAEHDDVTSLKRKSAVSNCKAACGAGFRRKGGIGGKNAEQDFIAAIAFVLRERADKG